MRYFPVFMDLRDQAVVVIGAGRVAERKCRLLIRAGARVGVVARHLNDQFRRWSEAGTVRHIAREYSTGMLREARLVFAATGDPDLNGRVYQDAEAARIPVNVVDDVRHCRFISPAVVDRSPIQIAISTGGSAPVLARRIRTWIEALLPLGLGRVAEALGGLREEAAEGIPAHRRRPFWERVLSEQKLRSWSLQSRSEVNRQLRKELESELQRERDRKLGTAKTRGAVEPGQGSASGRVYLVGAGPGRADLLTLRALHVLSQADVILHDRLVSKEVLDLARRDADRIDVGKRAGSHYHKQEDIHRQLLQAAGQGLNVVRLKGGDSFVFGRGGEEIEFLRKHGIAYEVVPGITAAIGCAAFSGIPLTHRDHAQVLTFVTGHLSENRNTLSGSTGSAIRWKDIVGQGKTVVIYMGVQQAGAIRTALLKSGVNSELPAALVVNGTLDRQRVIHGRVESLAQMAAQAGHGAPGLLIIGQVAALGSNLGWFTGEAELKTAA